MKMKMKTKNKKQIQLTHIIASKGVSSPSEGVSPPSERVSSPSERVTKSVIVAKCRGCVAEGTRAAERVSSSSSSSRGGASRAECVSTSAKCIFLGKATDVILAPQKAV